FAQERAGRVEELAGRIEGALQLYRQRIELRELLRQLLVDGRDRRDGLAEPARAARGADEPRDLQQLLRLERALARGAAQRGAHIQRVGERHFALAAVQIARLFDQAELALAGRGLLAGQQRAAALLAHGRARELRELCAQRGPAQLRER